MVKVDDLLVFRSVWHLNLVQIRHPRLILETTGKKDTELPQRLTRANERRLYVRDLVGL